MTSIRAVGGWLLLTAFETLEKEPEKPGSLLTDSGGPLSAESLGSFDGDAQPISGKAGCAGQPGPGANRNAGGAEYTASVVPLRRGQGPD